MADSFPAMLKDWRRRRRVSQLDLGLSANVSARHVAFLETGRSKPSRGMVLQLSDALMIPPAERNALLNAAGFSASYRRRDLTDPEIKHVYEAVTWTLERHDPFPGLAIDRHWTIVMANKSATLLIAAAGLSVGDSLLDAAIHSPAMRAAIENWSEVARYMATRLRTESVHLGGDPVLDAAAAKLAGELRDTDNDGDQTSAAVVATRYRAGDVTLSLFSTIAQFGSAADIALADLKIELMFPADEATRQILISSMNEIGEEVENKQV